MGAVRPAGIKKKVYQPVDTEMKRFEERTVVITGASRGIGKGIAKRFADEGANLVLAANETSVDAVADEFRASARTPSRIVRGRSKLARRGGTTSR